MEQIVLNANLRYVIAGLSMEQRGMLLDALLSGDGGALGDAEGNIYKYIMLLQQELADKKQKMRELGAKGGVARKKAAVVETKEDDDLPKAGLSDALPLLNKEKRKEAKEKNILNKKIKNLFSEEKKNLKCEIQFEPPLLEEVEDFIKKEGLNVDAETFVDFYDSHGWKVGQTAIKNWKATAKLWHRRADKNPAQLAKKEQKNSVRGGKDDDEAYWHELLVRAKPQSENTLYWGGEEKVALTALGKEETNALGGMCVEPETDVLEVDGEEKTAFVNLNNLDGSEAEQLENTQDFVGSPFVRFIKRIEEN